MYLGERLGSPAPRTAHNNQQRNNTGEKKMETTTYRFDHQTGAVYAFDESQNAYFFIGRMNGRTEQQFINDIEECELLDDDDDDGED
jgi:hypothetical protein